MVHDTSHVLFEQVGQLCVHVDIIDVKMEGNGLWCAQFNLKANYERL